MYKRILLATDGSSLSDKAVNAALDLAALTGAQLYALRVVPRYPMSYFEGTAALAMEEIARVEKQWQTDAVDSVKKICQQAQKKGVDAKPLTTRADLVAQAIVAAAKKHRCDLIVMASHGRKGFKRLLLGSETLQVLTHSTVPTLVLR